MFDMLSNQTLRKRHIFILLLFFICDMYLFLILRLWAVIENANFI